MPEAQNAGMSMKFLWNVIPIEWKCEKFKCIQVFVQHHNKWRRYVQMQEISIIFISIYKWDHFRANLSKANLQYQIFSLWLNSEKCRGVHKLQAIFTCGLFDFIHLTEFSENFDEYHEGNKSQFLRCVIRKQQSI